MPPLGSRTSANSSAGTFADTTTRTPSPARGLGECIRNTRIARGWSQHQLADAAGVSRPTVARVETGQSISTRTLERIVAVLGLQVEITPVDP